MTRWPTPSADLRGAQNGNNRYANQATEPLCYQALGSDLIPTRKEALRSQQLQLSTGSSTNTVTSHGTCTAFEGAHHCRDSTPELAGSKTCSSISAGYGSSCFVSSYHGDAEASSGGPPTLHAQATAWSDHNRKRDVLNNDTSRSTADELFETCGHPGVNFGLSESLQEGCPQVSEMLYRPFLYTSEVEQAEHFDCYAILNLNEQDLQSIFSAVRVLQNNSDRVSPRGFQEISQSELTFLDTAGEATASQGVDGTAAAESHFDVPAPEALHCAQAYDVSRAVHKAPAVSQNEDGHPATSPCDDGSIERRTSVSARSGAEVKTKDPTTDFTPVPQVPRTREIALQRYREKRQCRRFGQKARYRLRKANADSRPRVGGRFVGRTEAAAIRQAQTTSTVQQASSV